MILKNQILKDATDDLVRKYRNKCNQLRDKLDSMSVEQVASFMIADDDFDRKWTLNFIDYAVWQMI